MNLGVNACVCVRLQLAKATARHLEKQAEGAAREASASADREYETNKRASAAASQAQMFEVGGLCSLLGLCFVTIFRLKSWSCGSPCAQSKLVAVEAELMRERREQQVAMATKDELLRLHVEFNFNHLTTAQLRDLEAHFQR